MSVLNSSDFSEGEVDELALFTLPPRQTGVEKNDLVNYRPTSSLTDDSPVEFNIPSSTGDYVDLRKCRLYVRGKILNADGSNLADDMKVTAHDLFLQALWSQVDVSVQGQLVSTGTGNYPYKAKIQTALNYGKDAKSTQLQSQFYFDEYVINGRSTQFEARRQYTAGSKTFECEGPLYEDFFHIDKYFLNGCAIHLRLYRSRPEFHLETQGEGAPGPFKFVIEECIFRVAYVKIGPGVIVGHSKALEKTTAKYPLYKTVVKSTTALQNQLNFVWDSVFQNNIPDKLVVAFVEADAFSGTYKKSAFDFKMFDLSTLSVFVDGQNVSGSPMRVSEDNYVSAFVALFDATGTWNSDIGNHIAYKDIKKGKAFFVFSLAPYFPDREYINLSRRGNLRIECQFSKALPQNVNVIVYGQFPGLLEVDKARNIIFSNTSA